MMPWSNREDRWPHAVSCPQPADTGDREIDQSQHDGVIRTRKCDWVHLAPVGPAGSNLVVIILKVESNVGLNVATKRDQKLGAPSEL